MDRRHKENDHAEKRVPQDVRRGGAGHGRRRPGRRLQVEHGPDQYRRPARLHLDHGSNHTHTITIQKTEVDAPPANGINRQTSSGSGHTHSFVMTQAQLQDVLAGTPVVITSGDTSAHTHNFTISKWY